MGVYSIVVVVALWAAFWLLAVKWQNLWPVLAVGAWAPVVLLILISSAAWSLLRPSVYGGLGFVVIPNFWWQLGTVAALAAIALICGWLQGVMGWMPPEYPVEPVPGGEHGLPHGHH